MTLSFKWSGTTSFRSNLLLKLTKIHLAPNVSKYGLDKVTTPFKKKVDSPEAPSGLGPAGAQPSVQEPIPGTSRARRPAVVRHTAISTLRWV